MKWIKGREGDITAADTKTALQTMGSDTGTANLKVPVKAKYIKRAWVQVGLDQAAVDAGTIFFRLEGRGVFDQAYELPGAGAGAGTVAQGTAPTTNALEIADLDIPVQGGEDILCFAESAGGDSGTVTACIICEFVESL